MYVHASTHKRQNSPTHSHVALSAHRPYGFGRGCRPGARPAVPERGATVPGLPLPGALRDVPARPAPSPREAMRGFRSPVPPPQRWLPGGGSGTAALLSPPRFSPRPRPAPPPRALGLPAQSGRYRRTLALRSSSASARRPPPGPAAAPAALWGSADGPAARLSAPRARWRGAGRRAAQSGPQPRVGGWCGAAGRGAASAGTAARSAGSAGRCRPPPVARRPPLAAPRSAPRPRAGQGAGPARQPRPQGGPSAPSLGPGAAAEPGGCPLPRRRSDRAAAFGGFSERRRQGGAGRGNPPRLGYSHPRRRSSSWR